MTSAVDCAQPEICEIPIFFGMPWATIKRLIAGSHVRTCYRGDHLFNRDEPALFFGYVLSGTFKLSYVDEFGNEIIMHFSGKGEALGIMSLMSGATQFPFGAVAMDTARFLVIPKENFQNEWIRESVLMQRFQQELQARIFKSYDDKRIHKLPLQQKVSNLLVYLLEHKSKSEKAIDIPITRREIAAYVGSTVESVIRLMSEWSSKGWIKTDEGVISILEKDQLIRLANGAEEGVSSKKISSVFSRLWKKSAITLKGSPTSKYQL